MTTLSQFLQSRWYWLALALFGIALLGVALYYQYALGDEPRQACIHARLWVVAFTLVALIVLVTPQTSLLRVVGNVGVLIAGAGLFERSRYLYRLEIGIGDGSCQFQLGMPDWFAVMRRTGAFVPYVAGEEASPAAAAPSSALTRRAPAAARRSATCARARAPSRSRSSSGWTHRWPTPPAPGGSRWLSTRTP